MPAKKRHRNEHGIHTLTHETLSQFYAGTTRSSIKRGAGYVTGRPDDIHELFTERKFCPCCAQPGFMWSCLRTMTTTQQVTSTEDLSCNNPTVHYHHPQRHSRERKLTVYVGISWNVKGAGLTDGTHTSPPNKHTNCRHVQTRTQDFTLAGPQTRLQLHFSTAALDRHRLAHFCRLNSEQVVFPGRRASNCCRRRAVPNNRALGRVSDTTREEG